METTAQKFTEGTVITLAGRAFTVEQIESTLIGLTSDRGTGFAVLRDRPYPVNVHSLGSTLRHRGNLVRVLVQGDMITEVTP